MNPPPKLLLALAATILPLGLASGQTTYFAADSVTGTFNTGAVTGQPASHGNLNNIINGNGLPAGGVAAITDIAATSHGVGFASANTVVRDGGADGLQFDFAFAAAVEVNSVWVWNYTQAGCCEGRGVGDYEVYVDAGAGFGAVAVATGTLAASNHIVGSNFPQEINLGGIRSGVVAIRFVGLNRTDPAHNGIGLDEVAFALVDDPGEPLPPTEINLSRNATNAVGAAAGATLGALSSVDPNIDETFTYELVSGEGDTDNTSFLVDGANLNFASDAAAGDYSVRIRSTDSEDLSLEEVFSITVIADDAPSALSLLPGILSLSVGSPQEAGVVRFADPNLDFTPTDSHTIALANGEGDDDNGLFTLDPTSGLLTFNGTPAEGAIYAVRVSVTDSTMLTAEANFTVAVLNLAGAGLGPRNSSTDSSPQVFHPNNVPMPAGFMAGKVAVSIQNTVAQEGAVFRLYLLRPTGGDSFDIVYDSGAITIAGRTTGEVALFDFPNGPVEVQAGDVFAHYGRGIPFTDDNAVIPAAPPIYFPVPVPVAPVASPETPLAVNLGPTSDAEFPYRLDLSRDYAWAVLLEGGLEGPQDLSIEYDEGANIVTLRWRAEADRVYSIDGSATLETWPDDFDDSFLPLSLDAEFSLTPPEADRYFFRIRDAGSAAP